MGGLAITYTIRNEQRNIFQNMAVHRRLGAKHFFVFFDRCHDFELLRNKYPVDCGDRLRPLDKAATGNHLPLFRHLSARLDAEAHWAYYRDHIATSPSELPWLMRRRVIEAPVVGEIIWMIDPAELCV